MYKALTISLFFLLTGLCRAQAPNFFVDGARWVYFTDESSEPDQEFVHSSYEQIIIHGDTLINNIVYTKLYTTRHNIKTILIHPPIFQHTYDSIGPSFLRYDTVLKQVYYLPAIDSSERMIYDFNLMAGNVTPLQSVNFDTTFIYSIDTITLFGVSVKRFFIGDQYATYKEDYNMILEGIGGSNGLTTSLPIIGWLSGGGYSTYLVCFQHQDSIYAPFDGTCPFIDFVSATHDVDANYTLNVSPNPTHDFVTITISAELLNATYTIVDAVGRKVQSFKLTDLQTSAQLPTPGIYFWRVEHSGRLVKTGKVIGQ